MKKKILVLFLLFSLLCSFASGCDTDEKDDFRIYYLNAMGDGITPVSYAAKATGTTGLIEEALEQLAAEPEDVNYRKTIPANVNIVETHLDKEALSVYFDGGYKELTGYTEVLVRAAIVKTLVQIDGVESVSFFVLSEPLLDSSGSLVGSMTADTFVEDYGNETQSLATTDLTLYFASADGQSLVVQETEVHYNKNIARERLIIEYLLKGPKDSDVIGVIPSGTKVLNVTVADGVCYVNFDSTFLEQRGDVSSQVVLYAIVDSLTELSYVNKVQILVDGGSIMPANGPDFLLGHSYERDVTLVKRSKEETEIIGE